MTMLLDHKEKEFIGTYLTLPVHCPARGYSEMLDGGEVTREYLLDMEIFLAQISEHCHERWMFRRLFEDHQLRLNVERARREQPTIQEQDRGAAKKSFRRVAGWYKTVKRKIAAINGYKLLP